MNFLCFLQKFLGRAHDALAYAPVLRIHGTSIANRVRFAARVSSARKVRTCRADILRSRMHAREEGLAVKNF